MKRVHFSNLKDQEIQIDKFESTEIDKKIELQSILISDLCSELIAKLSEIKSNKSYNYYTEERTFK